MEKNQIAQRVRAFRKLKGFTQDELAQRMGVSIAVLGAIERGSRKAEAKMIEKIAAALHIDPLELSPVLKEGER
ncbi:helix-turn-helix domain-containing protein [Paenibacillus koleovorans]|uniref:helix-turn-helix domain-containing protein n=1 Tax=Paenibacillus koleovorans TaxID=121608 RepID=UPI000FDAF8DF|nr:helix-turn-helix transcriptional regulator [Paenibacillus koleovorans]